MTEPHAARQVAHDLSERVIIALDVSTAEEALEIVDDLRGEVGAFKIGLQLFTAAGPAIVRRFTSAGIQIFLDLKFHDIPNTVAHAAVEATRLGVWMFNIHAGGGQEMLRTTAQAVDEACDREGLKRPLVIGVTVLTSFDDITLQTVGISDPVEDQVARLARLAVSAGLDGVVASPLEAERLRLEIADPRFSLVTPGIRAVSATTNDQKRVTTVRGALANGSDYVVIGRPVAQADDRKSALAEMLAQ